jgi:hypothetical protein
MHTDLVYSTQNTFNKTLITRHIRLTQNKYAIKLPLFPILFHPPLPNERVLWLGIKYLRILPNIVNSKP